MKLSYKHEILVKVKNLCELVNYQSLLGQLISISAKKYISNVSQELCAVHTNKGMSSALEMNFEVSTV